MHLALLQQPQDHATDRVRGGLHLRLELLLLGLILPSTLLACHVRARLHGEELRVCRGVRSCLLAQRRGMAHAGQRKRAGPEGPAKSIREAKRPGKRRAGKARPRPRASCAGPGAAAEAPAPAA